jgi:hypothetical protein
VVKIQWNDGKTYVRVEFIRAKNIQKYSTMAHRPILRLLFNRYILLSPNVLPSSHRYLRSNLETRHNSLLGHLQRQESCSRKRNGCLLHNYLLHSNFQQLHEKCVHQRWCGIGHVRWSYGLCHSTLCFRSNWINYVVFLDHAFYIRHYLYYLLWYAF